MALPYPTNSKNTLEPALSATPANKLIDVPDSISQFTGINTMSRYDLTEFGNHILGHLERYQIALDQETTASQTLIALGHYPEAIESLHRIDRDIQPNLTVLRRCLLAIYMRLCGAEEA